MRKRNMRYAHKGFMEIVILYLHNDLVIHHQWNSNLDGTMILGKIVFYLCTNDLHMDRDLELHLEWFHVLWMAR